VSFQHAFIILADNHPPLFLAAVSHIKPSLPCFETGDFLLCKSLVQADANESKNFCQRQQKSKANAGQAFSLGFGWRAGS
jgi:hypothetical protein